MVKTNKKSLIAMIAMVVLLIASIAMGITGAWFYDKGEGNLTGGTFKFGTVSVEMQVTDSGVKHANGDAVEKTGDSYLLVPGDKVVNTFTIENKSDVDVYYIIKNGDDYYKVNTAKNGIEKVDEANAVQEWTTAEKLTLNLGFEIETSVEYGSTVAYSTSPVAAGGLITISGGAYKIAMIQKTNVTNAAAALTELNNIISAAA